MRETNARVFHLVTVMHKDGDAVRVRYYAYYKCLKSFARVFHLGTVMRKDGDGLLVRHYDGIESVVPREETYLITPEKFEKDCQYILAWEERLVGQAVVTRNEQDGMFHLGGC